MGCRPQPAISDTFNGNVGSALWGTFRKHWSAPTYWPVGDASNPHSPAGVLYVGPSRRCFSVATFTGISRRASPRTRSGTRSRPMP